MRLDARSMTFWSSRILPGQEYALKREHRFLGYVRNLPASFSSEFLSPAETYSTLDF
jgi:hypothetical protein